MNKLQYLIELHRVILFYKSKYVNFIHKKIPIQVAWLHSEKGTLAVHPHVITQNDRISVSSDHRNTYNLKLRDIRYESVLLESSRAHREAK